MSSLIIGQYLPIDSWVHRLDPRTKIMIIFAFVSLVFFANNVASYAVTILFTLLAVISSRVPLKYLIKGLKPVLFLIVFTFLLHIFLTKQGEIIWQLGWFKIYAGGLRQGIFISLRFLLLVSVTTLLTLTTTPIEITDGIESLFGPLKKVRAPVHEIALMMSIALRFIPTLMQEMETIMKAQMARGVEFSSGSLTARVKAIVPLLIPLFISAFKRAEELAIAMEARGYRGGEGRTKYRALHYHFGDGVALFGLLVFIGLLFWMRG